MHFENYYNKVRLKSAELADTVKNTADNLYAKISESFDFKSNITGLLLGNVQSGKTAQMLGSIAKLADEGFDLFIILSTDNVYLQQQTLTRSKSTLTTMNIIGEDDDLTFLTSKMSKATVVVLKKNTNILKKWRNLISSSGFASGRPIVIFDDEADAASLNTLINKKQISQINGHLDSIKLLATSSVYVQVTATPQAVLLQSNISGWKPTFVEYFIPGASYIGGDFIYSEPRSFCIRLTNENELDDIKSNSDFLPVGLRNSLLNYLVICAEYSLKGKNNCNFLVHPSVRIADHETFATMLGENLNTFLYELSDDQGRALLIKELEIVWRDLQATQPDISPLEDIKERVEEILTQQNLSIIVLNSKSSIGVTYNIGFNILVGGNSLGRGITLENLQVVYYCRKSKSPQADTFWQHSRVFGYDRIKGLLRIFIPPSLHEMFKELNYSNKLLIQQITNKGIDGLQLIYPDKIKPTRKNILDNNYLDVLVGGVNFFSNSPTQSNAIKVDKLLSEFDESDSHEVSGSKILEIINAIDDDETGEWNKKKYINCINALIEKRPYQKFNLIVRRDRNIAKGTGTLLSPTDRKIGDTLADNTALTVYRLNGTVEKGWKGVPFWIPNIKFPDGVCFYDTTG